MKKEVPVLYDNDFNKYTNESLLESIINYTDFSASVDYSGNPSGDLYIGGYIQPDGKFHVKRAILWAVGGFLGVSKYSGHVGSKSSGKCAKYVRLMLEAGGINTNGHPVAAKDYTRFLPSKGFKHIASLWGSYEQRNFSSNAAKPGDIAVMDHGTYGHICMWTGSQWVSDFIQRNMWVYSGNGTCEVFRYGGEMSYD